MEFLLQVDCEDGRQIELEISQRYQTVYSSDSSVAKYCPFNRLKPDVLASFASEYDLMKELTQRLEKLFERVPSMDELAMMDEMERLGVLTS